MSNPTVWTSARRRPTKALPCIASLAAVALLGLAIWGAFVWIAGEILPLLVQISR